MLGYEYYDILTAESNTSSLSYLKAQIAFAISKTSTANTRRAQFKLNVNINFNILCAMIDHRE